MTSTLRNPTGTGLRRADLRTHNERPMLLADWTGATFIHFALDPAVLRPHVPFPLDLHDGVAYVSLVAFTQRRLRPALGGRLAALLAAPLAEHPFLNLRTYVRVNGEPAIQFLSEWIPNRLAVLIGPATYGLPYRLGRLRYAEGGRRGEVQCRAERLSFLTTPTCRPGGMLQVLPTPSPGTPGEGWGEGAFRFACGSAIDDEGTLTPALSRSTGRERMPLERSMTHSRGEHAPSLDDFLLERYAAWTMRDGVARRFRIWHEPWGAERVNVGLPDRTLLDAAAPWMRGVEPVLAHHSPGLRDVWIGRPQRVRGRDFS